MTKRIFKSIVSVSLLIFALVFIVITTLLYTYFLDEQEDRLFDQLKVVKTGIQINDNDFLKNLNSDDFTYRVTLIGKDGKVLFDNLKNSRLMKNHSNREEVVEARKDGIGKSVRYSTTLTKRYIYVAEKLNDKRVLRIADSYSSLWVLVLRLIQPIVVVLICLVLFSLFIASKVSKEITKPLEEIDFDNVSEYKGYQEIKPFVDKIKLQNNKIKMHELEVLKKEELNGEMEKRSREQTSNISHELKTPLQTIMGYSELIKNNMIKDDDMSEIGETIYSESNRLLELIEDITSLTKIDEDLSYEKELVDISEVIDDALILLEDKIKRKNLTIVKNYINNIIFISKKLLNGIVYNIIDNAVKYNKVDGNINISVLDKKDYIDFVCKDSGIGIDDDDIENIYDRFYRADKSRNKKEEGTGLGLAIVKKSVEKCMGTIDVKSDVGKGTIFTITLHK